MRLQDRLWAGALLVLVTVSAVMIGGAIIDTLSAPGAAPLFCE